MSAPLIRRLRADRTRLARDLADTPPESARVRSLTRRLAETDAAIAQAASAQRQPAEVSP